MLARRCASASSASSAARVELDGVGRERAERRERAGALHEPPAQRGVEPHIARVHRRDCPRSARGEIGRAGSPSSARRSRELAGGRGRGGKLRSRRSTRVSWVHGAPDDGTGPGAIATGQVGSAAGAGGAARGRRGGRRRRARFGGDADGRSERPRARRARSVRREPRQRPGARRRREGGRARDPRRPADAALAGRGRRAPAGDRRRPPARLALLGRSAPRRPSTSPCTPPSRTSPRAG